MTDNIEPIYMGPQDYKQYRNDSDYQIKGLPETDTWPLRTNSTLSWVYSKKNAPLFGGIDKFEKEKRRAKGKAQKTARKGQRK